MAQLDRIRIAGFKSIRDQTVDLRPLNVLIGANGSGKSNFIGVFRLLHEILSDRLQLFVARSGGANRLLHFGRKVSEQLSLDLVFGTISCHCVLVPTSTDSLTPATLEWDDWGNPAVEEVLQSWHVYHFQDTSEAAKVKQTADLHDNAYLRPDAGNLAAFLYRLQETRPDVYQNIVDIVRMVAPFFGSFVLQPDRLNPDKIRLEWQELGSDAYFDAHSLSDGTLRFRILQHLPGYRKAVYGPLIAQRIGLDAMRQRCPHFHEWVSRLERLSHTQ